MYFEPANSNIFLKTNPLEIDSDNQEIKYKIKAILDQQEINDQPKYLIKWKGYPHSNNTWELEDNLNCLTILSDFQRQNFQSKNLELEINQTQKNFG